jgi:hypothetical protein
MRLIAITVPYYDTPNFDYFLGFSISEESGKKQKVHF